MIICFGLLVTIDVHCVLLFFVTDKHTNMLLVTVTLLKSAVVTMVCVVQECYVHYERKQAYVIIDLQLLVYVLYTIYMVILVRCCYVFYFSCFAYTICCLLNVNC